MGKHKFRQLKLKGTRKPNRPNQPPTEETVRVHRIKHLQRYQQKILNANSEELPKLINQLYSYLLKKAIISDVEFLKNELFSQLTSIINAYKYQYNPNEFKIIKNNLLMHYLFSYEELDKIDKNRLTYSTNWLQRYIQNNFNQDRSEIIAKKLIDEIIFLN